MDRLGSVYLFIHFGYESEVIRNSELQTKGGSPTNTSGIWKEKTKKFEDQETGLSMWIIYEIGICKWA